MPKIVKQIQRLFVKGLLDVNRRLVVAPQKVRREVKPHFVAGLIFYPRSLAASVCSEAMNASWVSNGPKERPCLCSFSL